MVPVLGHVQLGAYTIRRTERKKKKNRIIAGCGKGMRSKEAKPTSLVFHR